MGTTIWMALADTYVNFNREDWVLEHETDKGAIVSYSPEADTTVYISKSKEGVYVVILEE